MGTLRNDPSTLVHRTRLPHMGWNDVYPTQKSMLFNGLEQSARFYFLHSYHFHVHNNDEVIAVTDYGGYSLVQSILKIFSACNFIRRKATNMASSF
jgi:imidazoleglycerol phosphate synthase glutamine amidotransferase subunit HisH